MSEVKVIVQNFFLKVYIKETLHLMIHKDKIIGIQSWQEGETLWKIEFTLKDSWMLAEYTRKDLWEDILKGIDSATFI